jgi:hypothetical protein
MANEENTFKYEWDSLIIQLGNGEDVHGSIKIMKQDMDGMQDLHGMDRADILEMLVAALETTPKEQMITPEN